MDEVLAAVARLAAEAVGASYATVYEYRPHHDAIVYRAEYQLEEPLAGVHDDALGSVYAALGTKVTVVEMTPSAIPRQSVAATPPPARPSSTRLGHRPRCWNTLKCPCPHW